jgi:hypothetical protein
MDFNHPGFIVVFVLGLLFVIGHLIARVGGWSILSTFYRSPGPFLGKSWRFQSAQTRWSMGYNNCLTIGANSQGLYLSILFLFRTGHPPLFIPWTDISIHSKTGRFSRSVEFRFVQAPAIPFRVSELLGRKIAEAAGTAWPGEKATGEAGRDCRTP